MSKQVQGQVADAVPATAAAGAPVNSIHGCWLCDADMQQQQDVVWCDVMMLL